MQDRQIGRGDRYPALGLHWLLGLVRLAQDDLEEALHELDREQNLAAPNRLYGREYEMNAVYARGACLLRGARPAEAIDCFRRALELYPQHAQSHLGLALAFEATGSRERAESTSRTLQGIVSTLAATRPFEAALVESQILAAEGQARGASAVLCTLLENAPPGFAAWTIPVEPFLHQLTGSHEFATILTRLADRAR